MKIVHRSENKRITEYHTELIQFELFAFFTLFEPFIYRHSNIWNAVPLPYIEQIMLAQVFIYQHTSEKLFSISSIQSNAICHIPIVSRSLALLYHVYGIRKDRMVLYWTQYSNDGAILATGLSLRLICRCKGTISDTCPTGHRGAGSLLNQYIRVITTYTKHI